MNVTSSTPRRHTINIVNGDATVYNRRIDGSYSSPVGIKQIYAEWSREAMERKYGLGTDYKGLVIIDGLKKFSSRAERGYFTIAIGDKLIPELTELPIEEALEQGMKLYEVKGVTSFLVNGCLMSTEVTCG